MAMKDLIHFEDTSVFIQDSDVMADRKQIMELYGTPRKTLEDNINKLKEDGLVIGRNLAISSSLAKRDYKTEVYNLSEIIAIGIRLRSDKAIRFQEWVIDVIRKELIDSAQKRKQLQRENDWLWDREDRRDLYSNAS